MIDLMHMEQLRKLALGFLSLCVLATTFLPAAPVLAAPLKGYEAMQVSATGKLSLALGETKTVTVGFQNVGTETWNRDSGAFVSMYTYGPKYRTSVFQDASWTSSSQPARLTEAAVKPGEVGHVSFKLHAPSTAGAYAETFKLAAEDVAWVPGGEVVINVSVGGVTAPSVVASTPTTTAATATTQPPTPSVGSSSPATVSSSLSAFVLLRSAKKVTAQANEKISFTLGIKNTGTVSWVKRELYSRDIQAASASTNALVVSKTVDTVAPGSMDLIDFTFRAPSTKGSHVVSFSMVVDGSAVPDLLIDIPVEVTSSAPSLYQPPAKTKTKKPKATTSTPSSSTSPSTSSGSSTGIVDGTMVAEPTIRAGILTVDDETDNKVDISCETSWKLIDGNGGLLAELKKNESVEAFYKKDRYWYNRGKGLEKTSSYLRFVPDEANAVCIIENFDRTKTRGSDHPYNEFRNVLELRYNSAKDRTWIINELPMELYLRGLGETSNISHREFQKTLLTIARTYAFSMFTKKKKHADEYYDISSYADDQVYRGYGQEKITPNITAGVQATAGVIVTYQGETAITPYFSRSDGRTRAWGDVWYGEIEYLKSVPTPCDKGKTLWGHGVGMSASEALCQANGGKQWGDIIRYFYSGVELTKRWK